MSDEHTQKRRLLTLTLAAVLLLAAPQSLTAQEEHVEVQRPTPTKLHPLNLDLAFYAGGGSLNCGKFWKTGYSYEKIESVKGDNGRMYGSFVDVGLDATLSKYEWLDLTASLGYTYERYAYELGFFDRTGVHSHWLTTDVNLSCLSYVCVGLKSDFFLGSHSRSGERFAFEGINRHCFNSSAHTMYVGLCYRVNKFCAQLRYGLYTITPQLNANKLAAYNLEQVYRMKSETFELKLSYRLFGTKSTYYIYSTLED